MTHIDISFPSYLNRKVVSETQICSKPTVLEAPRKGTSCLREGGTVCGFFYLTLETRNTVLALQKFQNIILKNPVSLSLTQDIDYLFNHKIL